MISLLDVRVKQLVNVGVLKKTMARQANGWEAIVHAQGGWLQKNEGSKRDMDNEQADFSPPSYSFVNSMNILCSSYLLESTSL